TSNSQEDVRSIKEGTDDADQSQSASRSATDVTSYVLDLATCSRPVDWGQVFGNDRPVELEVGSGKGLFLVNEAMKTPGHNFLGIELAKKYAHSAAERIAKKQLTNVRILPGDARIFLAQFVPPSTLRAVHVYFPDPWWKKRHKKRRVFAEPLVADV